MNPWLIAAFLAAILGAGAGGFKLGTDHEVASQAKIDKAIKEAGEAAGKAAADQIALIKPRNVTIQQTLQKEIYEKPVYRDCVNTTIGLQSINAALTNSIVISNSKLPKADGAK